MTKAQCSILIVSGSPRSVSCHLIATMLHDGEAAKPRGDRAVQYYALADMREGRITPLAE